MSAASDDPRTNPFPGLRPFRQDEEHLFFGRENQVDAMVNRLAETCFLAVVGTSGSGKSSLVNCGLRPALRRGLMARAGTAWRMVQFRPGNEPIAAMARALARDGVLFREDAAAGMPLTEIIETTLNMSKLGLVDIWEQAALGDGINLLVVVDQFEELFRYRQLEGTGEFGISEQAAAFVNLLLEVKEQKARQIFVVLTMRSDFLGDCTQFPGLAEAINAGQYLVPRMTRDERRAAIVRPVEVAGAEISPVLSTRLVNDVGDNPDQLSILQHALNRTWARWQSEGGKGPLDLSHYQAIGTMAHALDQHAERAYAELQGKQPPQICEKVFKALTDKATDPRGVRRPTTLATLCALSEATPAEVAEVIEVFRKPSRSFLMPPAGDELKATTVIDISHESLMRVWERLKKWADEEAQSARTYRRLADTADLHAAGNASLWRDPDLQVALNWRNNSRPNEAWAARYHPGFSAAMQFLAASRKAREAERAREERVTKLMGGAAILCALLAAAAGYLWLEARSANEEAQTYWRQSQDHLNKSQITESRSLVKTAGERPNDQSRKILLALEGVPDAREKIDRPIVFAAQTMLAEGFDNLRELGVYGRYANPVTGVAFISGESRVFTRSPDSKMVELRDAVGGNAVLQLNLKEPVRQVAATSDGRLLITNSDRAVRIWDTKTSAQTQELLGHQGKILAVAATPNGDRIATGSDNGVATIWNTGSGVQLQKLAGHTDAVLDVAITPDGARIVTASGDSTAWVWNAGTGERLHLLAGHTGPIISVAISPDGAQVVTGADDGSARIWDANTGAQLHVLKHESRVADVAITSNGARIITGDGDGVLRVWDAANGAELLHLHGHTDTISSLAVSPDGTRVITSSEDGTVRTWDVQSDIALLQFNGPAAVLAAAMARDGASIVTGSRDGSIQVWDAKTGAELRKFDGGDTPAADVAITPDNSRIITTGMRDRSVKVLDARTGAELLRLKGHTGQVLAVAVTSDGARIVTGSSDRTARVWDASTGAELLKLTGHTNAVRAIAITPDGSRVITGSSDRTTRVWDINTGASLHRFLGHSSAVMAVATTPDGKRIITGSADRTARIWDANGGAELLKLEGHGGAVTVVASTPDGTRILTGATDVRIWDANDGIELLRGNTGAVRFAAVAPDGLRIVTGSGDTIVRVWGLTDLRPSPPKHQLGDAAKLQPLVDSAKRAVPRCLSIDERKDLSLRPAPPGWCIEAAKYPYDAAYWREWKAGKEIDDSATADAFAGLADKALKEGGDMDTALAAAEFSIRFDKSRKKNWLFINLAHAHMLLGRTKEAREAYLAHAGERIESGMLWEDAILDDFEKLRANGRANPLMIEVENVFKKLPTKADDPP